MVQTSFGLVFGFTIFLFAVAAFIVGLVIYLIIRKCRKKKEHRLKDLLDGDIENVKTEPDGASWESPMAEFDEAISYAENSLPRDHISKLDQESPKLEPKIDEPILEEEIEQSNKVEEIGKSEFVNHGYEKVTSEELDGPVYAKVEDHLSQTDKKQVFSEVQNDVGKLQHRVSFYESALESSSLVRPSKKSELEGIRTKVVSGLVNEFESSDKILIGRQITKDSASSYIPKKNDTIQNGHLDSDTGEPLYSVPDLARKSSKIMIGQTKVEDKSHEVDDETESKSPGVPPKVLGL